MRLDPYYVNWIVDSMFRGDTIPAGAFTDIGYFALLKTEPYPAYFPGDGTTWLVFDEGDEVAYTGYARQAALTNDLTTWRATQGGTSSSTGTSGETGPVSNIFFPLCTTSSETVSFLALCYDSDLASRSLIAYWALDRPFSLSSTTPGFYPCIPSSLLSVRIDD